jgi:hypothetical protein
MNDALEAARRTAAETPNPIPGTWAAHLHAALAEVDRLRSLVDNYGTPLTSYPPLPPPDPSYELIEKERTELETGYTDQEWAVGKVLCPAREKCPEGIRAVFQSLKNGRLPMHRDDTFGHPCPGARQKPTTPPLKLRPYCLDFGCVTDECSPSEPCCIATCSCVLTQHCTAKDTGDVITDFDGTLRDILYCTEHKNEWVN